MEIYSETKRSSFGEPRESILIRSAFAPPDFEPRSYIGGSCGSRVPVTTTQDYTLFNILNDYSIDLWKKQIDLIMEKHGLISVIVHPDYVGGSQERTVYEALLAHLADLRSEKGIWIAAPGEVDRWWRQRAEMKLVEDDSGWHIEGPGSERARIAYANQKDGRISYTHPSALAELSRSSG